MKKIIIWISGLSLCVYAVICIILFFNQEKMIFFPQKLNRQFKYDFDQEFEEFSVETQDNILLNSVLFKANRSNGVIFYLHGNAGSINSWGGVAKTYTDLNYDVFLLDYRGFGKSEGSITSQEQLFNDVQAAYDFLKTMYKEEEIIVLGYSIGTGPASKVASVNHPKLLILQAPYYSLTEMVHQLYPVIPAFILKYKLENYKYIQDCKAPVIIFHGNKDEVIDYNASLKLKTKLKQQDTLITLDAQTHNGITDNELYKAEIRKILGK